MEKNYYFLPNLETIVKDEKMLDSFNVDFIDIETLMWQTGYLTIDDKVETSFGVNYKLKIPNLEVLVSTLGSISDLMSKSKNSSSIKNNIYNSLIGIKLDD